MQHNVHRTINALLPLAEFIEKKGREIFVVQKGVWISICDKLIVFNAGHIIDINLCKIYTMFKSEKI